MPRMGDLAATDVYSAFDVPGEQSTNVGWANRMGEILTARPQYDESTIYKTASPLVNISEGDIGRATEAAMGVSGGGMMTKPVKPLPEKQFYNQYSQHVDLRNRGNAAAADEVQRRIMEEGFRQSGNVNTLPAYRGGQPMNIVDMKLAPKSGDTVYLVPNTATTDMGNGLVINKGWKPEAHEILKIAEDYPSLYKEYLKAWGTPGGGGSGGGGGGIKAYHSSPHDFDKFDLAKIGTGEGAQVYGHGLYFAESPAVSGQGGEYWKNFLSSKFTGPEHGAASQLQIANFSREKALEGLNREIEITKSRLGTHPKDDYYSTLLDYQIAQRDMLTSGQPVGPRTYEVSINADPAHMLDWDRPLTQQASGVRDIMGEHIGPRVDSWGNMHARFYKPMDEILKGTQAGQFTKGENYFTPGAVNIDAVRASVGPEKAKQIDALLLKHQKDMEMSGADAYRSVTEKAAGPEIASQQLREAGIPGIKYLDQGSRGPQVVANLGGRTITPKPPTSNYVIFDPGIIDIMKKYGIAGAAATPVMGALAAQDRYQQ